MKNSIPEKNKGGRKRGSIDGFVLVDKPKGITSFDVIRRLRRILRFRKMGHLGTLDPNATGLLPICLGKATRLSRFLLSADKKYRATVRLGRYTTTFDAEGETVGEPADPPELTDEELEGILDRFRGTFKQRPPIYSAKKLDGKRLYQLAREGQHPEPKEYDVHVHKLEVLSRDRARIEMEIAGSSGMYVRSLANDIGREIGCGAYLEELTRLAVGALKLEDSHKLEEIERMEESGDRSFLLPMKNLLADFPTVEINPTQRERIRNGNPIVVLSINLKNNEHVNLISAEGDLIAVGMATKPLGSTQIHIHPKVVIV